MKTPKASKKVEAKDDEVVWNVAVKGKPACSICFSVPIQPVYLPCRCSTLLCFMCFQGLLKEYSKCHICREMILPKLRKKCKGKNLEALIDTKLWEWIKVTFPREIQESFTSSALDFTDDDDGSWKKRHIPPEPGELRKEADSIVAKHVRELESEEKASELLLNELKNNGDADIVEIERCKLDEEFARCLQQQFNQVITGSSSSSSSSSSAAVIVLVDDEDAEVIEAPGDSSENRNSSLTTSTSNVKKVKTQTCWICKFCTFAGTETKWLSCEVCGSRKN